MTRESRHSTGTPFDECLNEICGSFNGTGKRNRVKVSAVLEHLDVITARIARIKGEPRISQSWKVTAGGSAAVSLHLLFIFCRGRLNQARTSLLGQP